MVVYWAAVSSVVGFGKSFSPTTSQYIVGIATNIILVFFYGAPLSTIFTVLKTKSSATIHIPTALTNTLNGVFWAAFGIAVFDLFIAVPNGLGAILGGIQILLCLVFPRKPRADVDNVELRGDVEQECPPSTAVIDHSD